jgi:hypothetical protein
MATNRDALFTKDSNNLVTGIVGPTGKTLIGIDGATGDIIANIIPRTGALGVSGVSGLLQQAGGVGEIASATDQAAIVQYNGVAGQGTVYYPVSSTLKPAVITTTPANNIPGTLSGSKTYSVGTHFTTLSAALTFFQQCVALPGTAVTLCLPVGQSSATILSVSMPWLKLSCPAAYTAVNGFVGGASGIACTNATVSAGTDGARTIAYTVSLANAALLAAIASTGHFMGVEALAGNTYFPALSGVNAITSINTSTGVITCPFTISTDNGAKIPSATSCTLWVPAAWINTDFDITFLKGIEYIGIFSLTVSAGGVPGSNIGSNLSPLVTNLICTNTVSVNNGPYTLIVAGKVFVGLFNVASGSVDLSLVAGGNIYLGCATGSSASNGIYLYNRAMFNAVGCPIFSSDGVITAAYNSLITAGTININGSYINGGTPNYLLLSQRSTVVLDTAAITPLAGTTSIAASSIAGSTSFNTLVKNTSAANDGSYLVSP